MTQRQPAADRLPMLTEVVEYEGDVIRFRSLSDAVGPDGVPEQLSAVVADAGAAPAGDGTDVGLQPADAAPALPWPEEAIGQLERRLADALDQHLNAAFSAIFERAAETARRECQTLMLEVVRDLRQQGQQGLDVEHPTVRPADAR